MKSRNWVLTLNNPSSGELNSLLIETNTRCLLAILERGECGTIHYQGILQLKTARAISTLHKILPRAHFEVMRGTKKEAFNYVLKTLDLERVSESLVITSHADVFRSDGSTAGLQESILPNVIATGFDGTYGELLSSLDPKKKRPLGERLQAIRLKIVSGATEEEISEEHFEEWVRYRQSFKAYRTIIEEKRSWKSEVVVIQGPTGTGKSKHCAEEYPDAYWKSRDQWWDGYEAHETVIIDEFYGWIPFDLLLRMLDRYPLQVEIKGGKTNFAPKKIVITTNKNPRNWYKDVYFPALARRVDEWWVFGTVFRSKYTDVNEARFIELDGSQIGDINNMI